MVDFDFSESIAFAVFMREPEVDQRLNSDLNYGALINRFHPQFRWISTLRNFEKSPAIYDLWEKIKVKEEIADILFLDWLNRTCINFLRTNSAHLLILDSSLAIPEEFEVMLLGSITYLNAQTEALSVWPVLPSVETLITESYGKLEIADSISRLAFLLTRQGAKKIESYFYQNPCGDFTALLHHLNLLCQTIAENAVGRPYVFIDLEQSQNKFAYAHPILMRHTENLLNPTPITSSNQTPKVQAYISHWFSTWDSIDDVETACKDFGYATTVLNTTLVEKAGWTNGIPISFFRQMEFACSNFNQSNDFLLFITADVRSNNWSELFSASEKILAFKGVGSFSPTLSHEWYHLGRSENYYYESDVALAIVPTNDLIVTYIHKSVVSQMNKFFEYFCLHPDRFDPVVGVGIELLMKKIIHDSGQFSLRSRRHILMHPYSKSYEWNESAKEFYSLRKIQDDFFANQILHPSSSTPEMIAGDGLQEMIDAIQWL
jgi:hypothetical protein